MFVVFSRDSGRYSTLQKLSYISPILRSSFWVCLTDLQSRTAKIKQKIMRLLSIFLWSAFILNWVLHLVNNLDALRHWTPSLYVLIFLLYTSWWVCLTTIWFVDYFMYLNSWNNRGSRRCTCTIWCYQKNVWIPHQYF